MPMEFSRKPRSLKDLDRLKATEFRAFLLCIGLVCLLGVIDDKYVQKFSPVSYKYFLLSLPNTFENVEMARTTLKSFVQHFEQLYGSRHLVYNVHNLLHIPDDVANYGSLDQFSALPFENYLGLLKKNAQKT